MEYKIKKSRFLVFFLSLIPGGGHMYLGLLKQGLELMCMFFGTLIVTRLLNLQILSFICLILIFYSIFDALSKRESDFDDKEAHCDIINWIVADNAFSPIGPKFIGGLFVVIGVLFVLFNFLPEALQMLNFTYANDFMHILKTGITAVLLIAGGLYLAFRKPKPICLEEACDHHEDQ